MTGLVEFMTAIRCDMSDNRESFVLDDSDSGEGVSTDDSVILNPSASGLLVVQQTGPTTVVALNHEVLGPEVNIAACREEIAGLISEHDCNEFVIDLTDIRFMPSGTLGLIASIRNLGVKVAVHNPTEAVREVFEITHLDTIVELRDE